MRPLGYSRHAKPRFHGPFVNLFPGQSRFVTGEEQGRNRGGTGGIARDRRHRTSSHPNTRKPRVSGTPVIAAIGNHTADNTDVPGFAFVLAWLIADC